MVGVYDSFDNLLLTFDDTEKLHRIYKPLYMNRLSAKHEDSKTESDDTTEINGKPFVSQFSRELA